MIKRVYKYDLPEADIFQLRLPEDAEILTIQTQREKPCLWTLIDPLKPFLNRTFRLAGTGHAIEISDKTKVEYIGTFQLSEGWLVFHLFEFIEIDSVKSKKKG